MQWSFDIETCVVSATVQVLEIGTNKPIYKPDRIQFSITLQEQESKDLYLSERVMRTTARSIFVAKMERILPLNFQEHLRLKKRWIRVTDYYLSSL